MIANRHKEALLRGIKLFDLLVMTAAFVLASAGLLGKTGLGHPLAIFSLKVSIRNIFFFGGFLLIWHGVLGMFGIYRSRRLSSVGAEMFDLFSAVTLAVVIIGMLSILLKLQLTTFAMLRDFWAWSLSLTMLSRVAIRVVLYALRKHGHNLRHIVIAGTNRRALSFYQRTREQKGVGYRVIAFVDDPWPSERESMQIGFPSILPLGQFGQFLRANHVDEVFIYLPLGSKYKETVEILRLCEEHGTLIRMPANPFEVRLARATSDVLAGERIMTLQSGPQAGWALGLKRALDVVLATVMLIMLAPFFVLIACLIRLNSPGPVFFSRKVPGLNKRPFPMYKFRTMVPDADTMQADLMRSSGQMQPGFKLQNDPRITAVGKLLRRASLDELPQLWNVLTGDMSIVGPRPVSFIELGLIPDEWMYRRQSVKPGLTGPWQISGRSDTYFKTRVNLDLAYIDNWHLLLDFQLILKTIPAILRGKGAY